MKLATLDLLISLLAFWPKVNIKTEGKLLGSKKWKKNATRTIGQPEQSWLDDDQSIAGDTGIRNAQDRGIWKRLWRSWFALASTTHDDDNDA